jgi:uncharacterized protein (TIGR00297 family)
MLVTIVNHERIRCTLRKETQNIKIRRGGEAKISTRGRKAIPEGRERAQSAALTWVVGALLVGKAVVEMGRVYAAGAGFGAGLGAGLGAMPGWLWGSLGCSAGFGLLVWRLRSATGPAAAMGAVICLNLLLGQWGGRGMPSAGWRDTGLPTLLALFVLTFAATRFGRARKEAMGTAEARTGRRASQVIANLGVAGLCAGAGTTVWMAACVAALAEATADTVSSEMGQAFAGSQWGKTLLITTGRPVAAGTDGGVSVAGTLLGMAGALATVALSPFAQAGGALLLTVFGAGCAGLIFDSMLGATVERRGWLGNDLVNFTSTVFAALLGFGVAGF